MFLKSFSILLSLAYSRLAAAQGVTALPALTGPAPAAASAATTACGGCYVVADVVGLVFGAEALTLTDTNLVSVGVGRNGTNITTTSVIQGSMQFSFNSGGLITGGPVPTNGIGYGSSSILVISGASLTSPTQYEVFTAYSITSSTLSNGQCVAVRGSPTTLASAFQVPVPSGAGPNFLITAEQSFISKIGGPPTCSAGGANLVSSSHTILETVTTNSTTVGPITATPAASVTALAAATSTAGSVSIFNFFSALATRASTAIAAAAAPTSTSSSSASAVTVIASASTIVFTNGTGFAGPSPSQSFFIHIAPATALSAPASWILGLVTALTVLLGAVFL